MQISRLGTISWNGSLQMSLNLISRAVYLGCQAQQSLTQTLTQAQLSLTPTLTQAQQSLVPTLTQAQLSLASTLTQAQVLKNPTSRDG